MTVDRVTLEQHARVIEALADANDEIARLRKVEAAARGVVVGWGALDGNENTGAIWYRVDKEAMDALRSVLSSQDEPGERDAIRERAEEYIDKALAGQQVSAVDRARAVEKVAAYTRKLEAALSRSPRGEKHDAGAERRRLRRSPLPQEAGRDRGAALQRQIPA